MAGGFTPVAQNSAGTWNTRSGFALLEWTVAYVPMSELDQVETTRLLRDWAKGDRAALDMLTPRVYKELRRVAGNLMQAEQGGRTLTATALVHEAYLRLVDVSRVEVEHRAHFLALAAKVMRQILLDKARRRHAGRRGGGAIAWTWTLWLRLWGVSRGTVR
jgi:hypothetical protein